MFLTILGVLSLIVIYVIGKFLRKNIVEIIIISLLIGLFFEMTMFPMFIYDTSKVTFFFTIENRNIPIGIILSWGCVLSFSYLLTKLLLNKLLKSSSNLSFFLSSLISILITGVPSEFLGYYMGYWKYSFGGVSLIYNIPWTAILGWIFFGTTFLATIRVYEKGTKKIR